MDKKVMIIPAQTPKSEPQKMQQKLRTAAYCRVSTDHEDQLDSLENQMSHYLDYIRLHRDYELVDIYSDSGISGTSTKKRAGFMRMIRDSRMGKIDFIITKSISRFARNTADCLKYMRELKALGIPIFFEKENINSMESSGELLFTILSSLAQEESRNISENTTWGIRSNFKRGIPHLNVKQLMGYEKDENGDLVIDESQARVVRRIYSDFLQGKTPLEIAKELNREGVCGVHGRPCWAAVTIIRMLRNEKYVGDLLMQKTYTKNFIGKVQIKNNGEVAQYYIRDNHPAIIHRDDWEKVQRRLDDCRCSS